MKEETSRRPERLGWLAAAIGVLLLVSTTVLANVGFCTALTPAAVASAVLVLLSLVSGVRMRLARRQAEEEAQVEEYRREHAGTELFEDSDEAVKLAARASRNFVKFFVPGVTLLLGVGVLAFGLLLLHRWNAALAFPAAAQPLRHAVLALGLALGAVVAGSYYVGVSRETGCRWLRPTGAWMFSVALLMLGGAAVLLCEHSHVQIERLDVRVAKVALGLLLLLGVEQIVEFVIEFYRPRTPGEEEQPLYESRILALFTEPGGVARNVATSLDYQFGFKVSEVWFYRFLERTLMPFGVVMLVLMWLLTCIVVVNPEENGIRELFGRVVTREPLRPGIYFKLPSPFARIFKFRVERVQEIPIGYVPPGSGKDAGPEDPMMAEMQGDMTERVLVWSKYHAKDETDFIVASTPEIADVDIEQPDARGSLPVTVYFMAASIPLYFKVTDLYAYAYGHRDALKTLEELATREVVRYLANVDFFAILTKGRADGSSELQRRIQTAADERELGIEVVFVGLEGLHPPVRVGQFFDEVVGAMEEKHERTLRGEEYAIQKGPAAEGEALTKITQAKGYALNRVRVAEAEADRFGKQLMAYEASPKLFVLGSFLDVLEQEGAHVRKYVVATTKGSEVFVIDLQKKMRPDLLDLDLERKE
ncbi:MAG: hypothetical protein A3K19_11220 [Lentisphaerae bacterium RIFOXYB12_FULL_65_16]|nr:MAG: hypothetical protein A3K18_25210 [Lentisphaerae bacterium RIFOXYA12_64_32]OGV90139.1 MAG: hypothetical protein A3K19_11220 [Lentisphaerae bacterium RIFOXYB12_FULL_65_16]